MIKIFKSHKTQDFLGRVLYLHNTIRTHFVIMGILCIMTAFIFGYKVCGFTRGLHLLIYLILATLAVKSIFEYAGYLPHFLISVPFVVFFIYRAYPNNFQQIGVILLINTALFIVSHIIIYGGAYLIITKDPAVLYKTLWNSLFTIAPTTSSFVISVFFTFIYSCILFFPLNPISNINALSVLIIMVLTSIFSHKFIRKTYSSKEYLPMINSQTAKRVVYLNIDGCRYDLFLKADLKNINRIKTKGVYYRNGAMTISWALTNPAFSSILTGTPPEVHGVKDNNIGQKMKVEALPDIEKSILYGCIHIKHIAKPGWITRVVSLPEYGFESDSIMFSMLKKDIEANPHIRLFIADLSCVDISGHAYGSNSLQYKKELFNADSRIGDFYDWMNKNNLLENTILIIGSDHGVCNMDHAYLLCDSEKYVPLVFAGSGIRQGVGFDYMPSIMDICPTISYALGIKYPERSAARVLEEIFIHSRRKTMPFMARIRSGGSV